MGLGMVDYLTRVAVAGARTAPPFRPRVAAPVLLAGAQKGALESESSTAPESLPFAPARTEGFATAPPAPAGPPPLPAARTERFASPEPAVADSPPLPVARPEAPRAAAPLAAEAAANAEARLAARTSAAEPVFEASVRSAGFAASQPAATVRPPQPAAGAENLAVVPASPPVPLAGHADAAREKAESPRPEPPLPVQGPRLVRPAAAEPTAQVRVPRAASPEGAGMVATQMPAGLATTTVRMPEGLRPALRAADLRAPRSKSPEPRTLDSRPAELSGSASGRSPVAEVSTDQTGARNTMIVAEPPRVGSGEHAVIEVTKGAALSRPSAVVAEPRRTPEPAVAGNSAPARRPAAHRDDPGRVRLAELSRKDTAPPPAVQLTANRPARPEGLLVRPEPRPARLTIGRIDVDVHVQPLAPAAAPAPQPVESSRLDGLEHRFLDRFGLKR